MELPCGSWWCPTDGATRLGVGTRPPAQHSPWRELGILLSAHDSRGAGKRPDSLVSRFPSAADVAVRAAAEGIQLARSHFALVVSDVEKVKRRWGLGTPLDEGDVLGLITCDDVLEELIGELADDEDLEREKVRERHIASG